jgi:beta-1,4-mannosyl-glycoprotein beta-1,4-N-acetylglucosaminyltransferase
MLIDAFLFFNETELTELRIKYLDKVVDYFVVIEADTTHQGKKKEWNFPLLLEKNLKEFSNKIQYHQLKIDMKEANKGDGWIHQYEQGGASWKIENMQRNYIKNACQNFASNDTIIISDCDEIPALDKVSFIKSCDFKLIAPIALEQFLFHLDCKYLNMERWIGSIATTKEIIDKYPPQQMRMLREKISHFTRGGWSFSSFGGFDKVKEKFESFAHEEYNKEKYKNEKHIKECIETGEDLFGRKIKKKKKIEKNFFPRDLLKLMEQNPKFYFGSSS